VSGRRASEKASSPIRRGERYFSLRVSLNGRKVSDLMGRLGASETPAGVLLTFFRSRQWTQGEPKPPHAPHCTRITLLATLKANGAVCALDNTQCADMRVCETYLTRGSEPAFDHTRLGIDVRLR
jgi:hypothetical protein